MEKWQACLVTPDTTIRDVVEKIDKSGFQIALVVDEKRKLLGTITDGDVRRGLLKEIPFSSPVVKIMKENPISAKFTDEVSKRKDLMKSHMIRHLPLLDKQGVVVGMDSLNEFGTSTHRNNWVILMAGGVGQRLHPLTEATPKPLLEVGGQPILKRIVDSFISYRFNKFFLSVNYKAEMIEQFFKNGEDLGVQIEYLRESTKLGTAGSLSLLPEKPTEPIIVMNGDILTKVNFDNLLEFHLKNKAFCTMCVRKYDFQVPYGVVELDDNNITKINEKPIQSFFVSSGIYVLSPEALDRLTADTHMDMPNLFDQFLNEKKKVCAFPIREYWLDIGQMDDFKRANWDVGSIFEEQ